MMKFVARAARLYEQEREEPRSPSRLGMYVRRWLGCPDRLARGAQHYCHCRYAVRQRDRLAACVTQRFYRTL
ncbi:MAG: hypothetical protein ACI9MJ_000163 [Alphaproteobacteria bacterium]|jgi:hypothetical protein